MSSADEAMGHLVQLVFSRLLASAKVAWSFSSDIVKDASERSEAIPTSLKRDVDDWKLGIAKQRPCALDPPGQEITVRRYSEGQLEGPCEVSLRYAADLGKPADGPFLVEGRVHSILGTKEPSQQQGLPADQDYLVSFR